MEVTVSYKQIKLSIEQLLIIIILFIITVGTSRERFFRSFFSGETNTNCFSLFHLKIVGLFSFLEPIKWQLHIRELEFGSLSALLNQNKPVEKNRKKNIIFDTIGGYLIG